MLSRVINKYKIFEQELKCRKWKEAGKPLPPPHSIKEQVIRQHADRFGIRTLVETGTCRGLMIQAVKKFQPWPHIKRLQGNSSRMPVKALAEISDPGVFRLDAHCSGGVTASAHKDTAIAGEIEGQYTSFVSTAGDDSQKGFATLPTDLRPGLACGCCL